MMVTHYMEHYFKEDDSHVFARDNEDEIINEFNRFVDRKKDEIVSWSEWGSGRVID